MPRRRKTVGGGSKRRPKARIPDGDEGKDLSEEQKAEKLRVLLIDFDAQVAARIKQMEATAANQLAQIENLTRMELLKIPKKVLDLEIDDLIEDSDNLEDLTVVSNIKDKAMKDYASSLNAKVNAATSQKADRQLGTISEESDDDPGTVKKGKKGGRTTRRKGTLKVNTSYNMPPPTTASRTRRTTRQQLQQQSMMTPGYAGQPSSSGWETPLVTPKFDPRLPKTPAIMRNPRPGERTMTISLAGSPLANRTGLSVEAGCAVPLGNNKTLMLTEDTDITEIAAGDLRNGVIEKLRLIHEKLGSVLRAGEVGKYN